MTDDLALSRGGTDKDSDLSLSRSVTDDEKLTRSVTYLLYLSRNGIATRNFPRSGTFYDLSLLVKKCDRPLKSVKIWDVGWTRS